MLHTFEQMLRQLSKEDVDGLIAKGKDYGDSWKKRGGIGAFMMLARKWDRLEQQVSGDPKWDVFEHGKKDRRSEGLLDDLCDLRRYLLLVEAEIRTIRMFDEQRQTKIDRHTFDYPSPKVSPEPHAITAVGGYTGQEFPFGFDPGEDCAPR